MSITFIVGETGAGKTAFATYLLKRKFLSQGKEIWKRSCELIRKANAQYGRNYSLPNQVPFYTNYHVKLHVGYKKYYEPYYFNPYYFGVTNEEMDTQSGALGGVMVFDEFQRIANSRKSATFADFASYAFEIHRQAQLEIYLLAQRGKLLDCNIRELGVHVIEIVDMDNEKDAAGNVVRSTWRCREFENWRDAEAFFTTGEGNYTETEYVNKGNIFESFDSFEKMKEFCPPQGLDFDYLPHKEPENATERQKKFYKPGEPKEYRGGAKPNKPKNGEKGEKAA